MSTTNYVTLHYNSANELMKYLDRKGISYTLKPSSENIYHYTIEFDDSPSKPVSAMVDKWIEMRRKSLDYCPFCGGVPTIERNSTTTYEAGEIISWVSYTVECLDCGCKTAPGVTEQDVIDVWNRRFEEE